MAFLMLTVLASLATLTRCLQLVAILLITVDGLPFTVLTADMAQLLPTVDSSLSAHQTGDVRPLADS